MRRIFSVGNEFFKLVGRVNESVGGIATVKFIINFANIVIVNFLPSLFGNIIGVGLVDDMQGDGDSNKESDEKAESGEEENFVAAAKDGEGGKIVPESFELGGAVDFDEIFGVGFAADIIDTEADGSRGIACTGTRGSSGWIVRGRCWSGGRGRSVRCGAWSARGGRGTGPCAGGRCGVIFHNYI